MFLLLTTDTDFVSRSELLRAHNKMPAMSTGKIASKCRAKVISAHFCDVNDLNDSKLLKRDEQWLENWPQPICFHLRVLCGRLNREYGLAFLSTWNEEFRQDFKLRYRVLWPTLTKFRKFILKIMFHVKNKYKEMYLNLKQNNLG